MNLKTVDDHTVASVKRVIVETGTAQVLRLVADLARPHAEDSLNAGCTRGRRQICARGQDARQSLRRACRLATTTLALKLAKQVLRADEMVVEDPPRGGEEFRDQGVTHRVPHAHAFLATGHDVVGTQNRQLLRNDRLLHAEGLLQFLNVPLPAHQELENPNANRVSERPEERGFERLKFFGGDFSHVLPFYSRGVNRRRIPWAYRSEAHGDRRVGRRDGGTTSAIPV